MNSLSIKKFARQEDIARNILFVDGITRCGKSLLSHVIGTFEEVEHIQFINPLEHLVAGVSLGFVDIDFARAFLSSHMNEAVYNTLLGRNINFRYNDQTGVPNHPRFKMYQDRLNYEDGDHIIEALRETSSLFPFMTHDMMVNFSVLRDLQVKFKMLEIYRNPITNIQSCINRGWGERFGADPRAFTLNLRDGSALVPWYAAGQEDIWSTLNQTERCVWMVTTLLRRSIDQQRQNNDENVLTFSFEDFVQNTSSTICRIEGFIQRKKTPFTDQYLAKANCPRILDLSEINQMMRNIEKFTRKDLYTDLVQLVDEFHDNVYGFCGQG